MNQSTDEAYEPTDETIEAPIAKPPRKKVIYTPEQLEKKREAMKKASQFRNIKYKEENKKLKEQLELTQKEPEPVEEEEYEPEPEIIKKTAVSSVGASKGQRAIAKPVAKPIPKLKQRIVYQEEEEEDEEEEYEEVIVRRRAKALPKQRQIVERPDLIDETYKEQLKKKLQDERRRQVMADLFDF